MVLINLRDKQNYIKKKKDLKEAIKDAISSNGSLEFVGLVPSLKQDAINVYSRDSFLLRKTVYMLKLLI